MFLHVVHPPYAVAIQHKQPSECAHDTVSSPCYLQGLKFVLAGRPVHCSLSRRDAGKTRREKERERERERGGEGERERESGKESERERERARESETDIERSRG